MGIRQAYNTRHRVLRPHRCGLIRSSMLIFPMLHKLLATVSLAVLVSAVTAAQTSSATARKFDEFGDIQASDLIARLDNLAVQLANEPNTKTFLVVYRT